MKTVVNFSNPVEVARICNDLRRLAGAWSVEVKRYRAGRTNKQNAAYWSMVCPVLADWITENWGQTCTPDDAHEILKSSLLRKRVTNPATGETLEFCGSTARLNVEEFSGFFDAARELVFKLTGVEVPDPDPAYVRSA